MAILNQTINASALPTDIGAAFTLAKPLLIYIVGIVIYSLFIFKLYRFVAHRDILKLHLHSRFERGSTLSNIQKVIAYTFEYIILVPLVIFFWFAFLATTLFLLGSNSVAQVLLISMALVAAIRVTAYYNEDLSRDLSKMLPFGLLAVFMVDISILSISEITARLVELVSFPEQLISYLLFVAAIEFVIRVVFLVHLLFKR